jgi:hypothetical protein
LGTKCRWGKAELDTDYTDKHKLLARCLVVGIVFLLVTGAWTPPDPPDVPVQVIALSGPAADSDAELSGLAWYGDTLLLLAQHPEHYAADGDAGAFFALGKAALLAYLDSGDPAPLEPRRVPIIAPDIRASVPGYDGFEAVTFAGDQTYLVIEALRPDGVTFGYLVRGTVAPGLSAITLNLDDRVELPPQTTIGNMGYESIARIGDRLVVFNEVNGAAVNPDPRALVFDLDLNRIADLPMLPLDYRVTDATAGGDDVVWALNTWIPAQRFLATGHENWITPVERLVPLRFAPDGVIAAGMPPVDLALDGLIPRNWEGLARLDDRGFLLVTDQWPGTVLGFAAVCPTP